jgi:CheY-like chemotaxis protein
MQDENRTLQSKKTIYLVDYELDTTTILKKTLEQNGFVAHAFNDPKMALQEFKQNGKDCTVILSDIRMPGMNGFQLARELSQLRPDVRIVLMSSFEINKAEFDKVLPSTDVAAFITKPVSKNLLLDTLGALFVNGR